LPFKRYVVPSRKGPRPIDGAAVRISMKITEESRRIVLDRVRPLLEPCGLSRVTVRPTEVLVEGLSDAEADVVKVALVRIRGELNRETAPQNGMPVTRARRPIFLGW
jgi:hypothetical protein